MEAKRQSLIKKCNERISEIIFCNEKDNEMLSRIKEQGNTSYVRNQINLIRNGETLDSKAENFKVEQ